MCCSYEKIVGRLENVITCNKKQYTSFAPERERDALTEPELKWGECIPPQQDYNRSLPWPRIVTTTWSQVLYRIVQYVWPEAMYDEWKYDTPLSSMISWLRWWRYALCIWYIRPYTAHMRILAVFILHIQYHFQSWAYIICIQHIFLYISIGHVVSYGVPVLECYVGLVRLSYSSTESALPIQSWSVFGFWVSLEARWYGKLYST